jgi:hypothetical protein
VIFVCLFLDFHTLALKEVCKLNPVPTKYNPRIQGIMYLFWNVALSNHCYKLLNSYPGQSLLLSVSWNPFHLILTIITWAFFFPSLMRNLSHRKFKQPWWTRVSLNFAMWDISSLVDEPGYIKFFRSFKFKFLTSWSYCTYKNWPNYFVAKSACFTVTSFLLSLQNCKHGSA